MDAEILKRLQTEPYFAFGEVANNNFEAVQTALQNIGLTVRTKQEAQAILNDLWLTDKAKLKMVLSQVPFMNIPGSRTDGILNAIVDIQSKRAANRNGNGNGKGCGCKSCSTH